MRLQRYLENRRAEVASPAHALRCEWNPGWSERDGSRFPNLRLQIFNFQFSIATEEPRAAFAPGAGGERTRLKIEN